MKTEVQTAAAIADQLESIKREHKALAAQLDQVEAKLRSNWKDAEAQTKRGQLLDSIGAANIAIQHWQGQYNAALAAEKLTEFSDLYDQVDQLYKTHREFQARWSAINQDYERARQQLPEVQDRWKFNFENYSAGAAIDGTAPAEHTRQWLAKQVGEFPALDAIMNQENAFIEALKSNQKFRRDMAVAQNAFEKKAADLVLKAAELRDLNLVAELRDQVAAHQWKLKIT